MRERTTAALEFDRSVEPLARPTTPEVDAILGVPIPLLDHGFVRLVDYMGNDAAIVQAARVSYGAGTKKVSEDKALIRYLLRHRHTSPFEMVETKFHIKAPIFVARQWVRHRTACLAGDSVLSFDLPGAELRGKRRHHGMTIEKFHRLWHEGTAHTVSKHKSLFLERIDLDRCYTIPELACLVERREETLRNLVRDGALRARGEARTDPRQPTIFIKGRDWQSYATRSFEVRAPMRDRLQQMHLRMCDEATGEIRHTQVTDIWQSGVKPLFRVTLENGKSLKMTKDHRCLTERGWMTLAEATAVQINDRGGVTWNSAAPAFATNGVPAYQSAEWLGAQRAAGFGVAAMAEQAGVSYHTIRKWLRIHKLGFAPQEKARLSGIAQRGQRRTPAKIRLFRQWSKIARIEYAGEEMTYDLAVAGPYHNFVANGLIVHNSVNEVSARYSILSDEMYLPDDTQISFQSSDNKQGRSEVAVPDDLRARVRALFLAGQRSAYGGYQELIDAGIARELARIALPVAIYTEWYWKINLHNLFHFLSLRADPHAQYEIRVYAEAIGLIVERLTPVAWGAYQDYIRNGITLSAQERLVVERALRGEPVSAEDWQRLGKRERLEFARKFDLTLDPATGLPLGSAPEAASSGGNGYH